MRHVAAMVLVSAGVLLVLFGAVGVLVIREPFTRLHFLTPASTFGIPLICFALMVAQGHNRVTLKVGVIGVLVLVAQPAVTAATARAIARQRGLVPEGERE